jgi:hypothetical protein
MYLAHFSLREPPFGITPDTSFFFACASAQEALNTLLIATKNGDGFIKIIGEVGTGKTLLCRKSMATLDDSFVTAYIPNPFLEPRTLMLVQAHELEIPLEKDVDQHQTMSLINRMLQKLDARGSHGVRSGNVYADVRAVPETRKNHLPWVIAVVAAMLAGGAASWIWLRATTIPTHHIRALELPLKLSLGLKEANTPPAQVSGANASPAVANHGTPDAGRIAGGRQALGRSDAQTAGRIGARCVSSRPDNDPGPPADRKE